MTAILAIESEKMFLDIVVDDVIDKAYGSMLYLKKGDSLKLEELVYGLMLRSGNDAALCIAKAVSGSVELFVEMMNKKAKSIGMHDTFFVNPHGLDESDGGNISTAKDMAILMSYAVKNENFVKISGTKSYRSSNYGVWKNKNKSLTMSEYIDGGKTGYTSEAGQCLASFAEINGKTYIMVLAGGLSRWKTIYETLSGYSVFCYGGEEYIPPA
jgi:D-alanyl-D-alanine carboxypeptidase